MTVGTLRIDGRKYRIVSEEDYKALSAAMRLQERQAREDAADVREARRRLKDPNRESIPLSQLKSELAP
jgi:hypothetical protein